MLRALLALAVGLLAALQPALAQQQNRGRSLAIVRDAEIEQLLKEYAAPVFRAAGLQAGQIDIILIQDRSFNAFVASGRRMFLNVGVLMDAETPNEVIGVLAHEAGHIAGGHLARLRQEMANAQILAVVGMLAGGAAAATAGRADNSAIGIAGAIGGGMELARRSLLAYQRSEEQAADRAAVRYLDATGQSAAGMLTTFRRFADSGLFSSRALDPYTLSHPLPQERVAQLERLARASPNFGKKDAPALVARHALARAKLFGFVDHADGVARRYPPHDRSIGARYARAILAHRLGRSQDALQQLEPLLRERPGNAFFHELRGQILLESGRPRQALEPLRRSARAMPSSALIRGMLGHALVASGDPALLQEAIRELSYAAQREPEWADPHRHLATAHHARGNIGLAEASAAQYAFLTGDLVTAHTQATRALQKLPPNSPAAIKAEDIVNYRPPRS